ncbi:FAD-binding protein [Paraburkholderia phymatum]|uniref:FAD-binding protein n=1 Tax=Paraburkholderia phymatum TaxID=148447 RepID=UPI003180E8B7
MSEPHDSLDTERRESTPADPRWSSYVQEPLRVGDAESECWDGVADVIVVGFGGAGACAALEARAHGLDVLALDRFGGGGATALCGGIYYGGATRHQRSAGYDDTPEEMYRYLKQEVGDTVLDSTLRKFCEDSNTNLEWLESHGVRFGGHVYDGKRSYPPVGYDLYFSGNEKVSRYRQYAKPAPRGHRVVGPKYTGSVLYAALSASAVQHGVRVHDHCPVKRLIVDRHGAVIGVEAGAIDPDSAAGREHRKLIARVNAWQRFFVPAALRTGERLASLEREHTRPVRIRALRGVILSTGSFAFNRQMVDQYAPKYRDAMPLGTLGCDGSGIRLGQSVGGVTDCMQSVTAWRSISPPISFVESVVVNCEGRRFINEDAYLGHLGFAVAEQTGGRAWVIIDRASYRRSFLDTVPVRGESWHEFRLPLLMNLLSAVKGRTLEELAQRCGIAPDALVSTVENYNAGVKSGIDEWGKPEEYQTPLRGGPYYAIDISIGSKKFLCPSIPMGGLVVDESTGHVMRSDGSRIKGLFAAGRAAKGIPSGFYVSGTSVADCVFSGRRAGLHVVGEGHAAQSSPVTERSTQ